jgi:hypothetical protein
VWDGLEPTRTLVLASAALHEFDRDDKAHVLAEAARHASRLVLVELAADHDTAVTHSADLRYRAAKFYDALIADAYSSLPSSEHLAVVGAFLLGELETMLTQPYVARQNYHLTVEKWHSSMLGSGFRPIREHSADLLGRGPLTYFVLAEQAPASASHVHFHHSNRLQSQLGLGRASVK